jgi:hypothetical protein
MIKMENNITFKFNDNANTLEEGLNVSAEQFNNLKTKLAEIDQKIINDITENSNISLIRIIETISNNELSKEELILAFGMITFSELKAQYEQKDLFKEFENLVGSQEDINDEDGFTYEELTEENDN